LGWLAPLKYLCETSFFGHSRDAREGDESETCQMVCSQKSTRQTIVWNAAGTIALGKTVFFSGHDLMVFSSQETNFNSEIWSFSQLVEAEEPGNLGVYKT
jgi:hypothetical protein